MGHVIGGRTNTVINWPLPAMAAQEGMEGRDVEHPCFSGANGPARSDGQHEFFGKEKKDSIF